MEALLAAEIFTFDRHLFTGFGFIWFNFGDGGALRAVADRIFLDLTRPNPLMDSVSNRVNPAPSTIAPS